MPEFSKIVELILNARIILSISTMFIVFLFMYKLSSKRIGEGFKIHAIGALFSAIAWYLISFFFSIYVDIFTNFSVIYGSLATITLVMMWLYAVIYAILLGAEINVLAEKFIKKLVIIR